jgi:hypothetical protein
LSVGTLLVAAAALWWLFFRKSAAEAAAEADPVGTGAAGSEPATGEFTVIWPDRPKASIYDTDIWNVAQPSVTGSAGNRSGALLDYVIDQFEAMSNPRYAPRNGSTFCNILVEDVMAALDAPLPWGHANDIVLWLAAEGASRGWVQVDGATAQMRANAGYPTVAGYVNPSGSGHMAVVRPGTYSSTRGPTVTAVGSWSAFVDGGAAIQTFGSHLAQTMYWSHD